MTNPSSQSQGVSTGNGAEAPGNTEVYSALSMPAPEPQEASRKNDEGNVIDAVVNGIVKQPQGMEALRLLSTGLTKNELTPILLHIFEERAKTVSPADVMKAYAGENRFVRPSSIDVRKLNKLQTLCLNAAPEDFDLLEASPLLPFGANAVLTPTNNKKVVTAIRHTEVMADATVALALEVALKRRALLKQKPSNSDIVSVCGNIRSVRAQMFEKRTGFSPHFTVFATCSGGRQGHESTLMNVMKSHLQIYLEVIAGAKQAGLDIRDVEVSFSNIAITEKLIAHAKLDRAALARRTSEADVNWFEEAGINLPRAASSIDQIDMELGKSLGIYNELFMLGKRVEVEVLKPLVERFPEVTFCLKFDRLAGIGYYQGLCFKVTAVNSDGDKFPLVDGGLADWTKKLLEDKKEFLFSSGMGTELMVNKFQDKKG